MAEIYYDSPRTGEELDAAFSKLATIDQNVQQAEKSAADAKTQAKAAASSAAAAAGSASDAQTQASQAQQQAAAASRSAGDAADSATTAQQNSENAAAQATAASQSADAAAQSAQDAAASVAGIQDDVAQSAENARNAAASAEAAASNATRAEEAAQRAEQIADFDPSKFATAEQGAKADTAVQPEDLGNYALKSEVPSSPADIGAATAAQGAKADTALQPGALNGYAQTSDIPSKLPNPQSLGIRLGQYGSTTYYDGSAAKTVTITPESIGAQAVGTGGAGGTSIVTGETKTFNWENGKTYEELIQIDASFSFAFISLVLSKEDVFAFLQNARGNVGFIASEAQALGGTKILDVVGYNGSGIDLTDCKIQYMYIPSE